jgi:prolyl-tRNA editing enzyme YbaK/EbsC (Cys-tRNA(Pro) deacylase)
VSLAKGPGSAPAARRGSLERVREYLSGHGLADGIIDFGDRSTKTCELAAEAVGCEVGQIVKSLVFVADGTPVLALVAGDRRGDTTAIAALCGAGSVRFADADTVRSATGYAIGGVSPYDLPVELIVLIDDSLERFDVLYTAAGTPSSTVCVPRETLLGLTGGQVARISRDHTA